MEGVNMPVKNMDIVGTYLNSISSSTGQASGPPVTNMLLSVLLGHQTPMQYKDFWKASQLLGYSGEDFSIALRRLRSAGAVQLQPSEGGGSENPFIRLTPLGQSVATVVQRGPSS
jgi:hypothetical protein